MQNHKTIQFTEQGYIKIEEKLAALLKTREEIVVRLRTAREMGDLSENGAYKAARFELSTTDHNIRQCRYLLQQGQVVKKTDTDKATFGSIITIKNETHARTFTLVDRYESDPTQNRISFYSPLGHAVVGKKLGDIITVNAPAGKIQYTITKLQ